MVDAQREYYEWTRRDDGLRIPIIEETFDWLEANWPKDPGETVLSWGDSRPGNMIYDGFTPVAVLDWEMCTLGPREVDLAWMCFLHRFFQDLAEVFELPGLARLFRRDEVACRCTKLASDTHRPRPGPLHRLRGAARYADRDEPDQAPHDPLRRGHRAWRRSDEYVMRSALRCCAR